MPQSRSADYSAGPADNVLRHAHSMDFYLLHVFGGMSGTMMRYSMAHFVSSLRVVVKNFWGRGAEPQALIDEIVDMADVARKSGVPRAREKSHF